LEEKRFLLLAPIVILIGARFFILNVGHYFIDFSQTSYGA